MVTVLRHRNVLYYASHNQGHDITSLNELHAQTGCVWFWLDAPEGIRREYRERPDFWAVAPACIAQQYTGRYSLRYR